MSATSPNVNTDRFISSSQHIADCRVWGLSPIPGVNAFQQAKAPTPQHAAELSKEALLARQRKYDAERRMKANALRVNQPTNWCQPSGLALQAKEIRAEMHKALANI